MRIHNQNITNLNDMVTNTEPLKLSDKTINHS